MILSRGNWRGNEEGSEIKRKVAIFFDDDIVSEQVKDAFSSRVLLGWEDAFQGRFSIRWASISTPENKKLISGLLKILMNRSRACWSNRSQALFGSRKDRCMLQRTRLHLHVKECHDAPRKEVLIDKSKLAARAIILSTNNDAIAKWLDR